VNDLSEFKNIFNPILTHYLDDKTEVFLSNTTDPFIIDLINHSKKLVENGGKRIRPYIAYLMYKALGGIENEEILKLLISLELFHTFALVHDDIMDRGKERHGVKTIQQYVKEVLEKDTKTQDAIHVGNSQAILVGDLFFKWAVQAFDEIDLENGKLAQAKTYFYKMIDDVCLGQIIDVDLSVRENFPKELIDKKNRLKSASYTFIRPLQIGMALTEIDGKMEKFCEDLGLELGLAYQMQDDLMDMQEDIAENQKNFSAGKTIEEIKSDIETHLRTGETLIKESQLNEAGKMESYELINILRNRKN
jgi:geranylgeranyl diphosphate synthase type I